jgi:hypothetical protein
VVQHSTQDSTTDLVPSEFPKQLDIAQVSVALMAIMFFAMGGMVSGLGVAKIKAL